MDKFDFRTSVSTIENLGLLGLWTEESFGIVEEPLLD